MLRPLLYLTLWLSILLFGAAALISRHQGELRDLVIWQRDDIRDHSLLYDINTGIQARVFVRDIGFVLISNDGHMALQTPFPSSDVEIWDANSPLTHPINITNSDTTRDSPLIWSPDGRYLVVGSQNDQASSQILLWDGAILRNITPVDSVEFNPLGYADWNSDNRLVFGAVHRQDGSYQTEIYIWSENGTVNLSQDSTRNDVHAVWSSDGKLAFCSEGENNYNIAIWDGISTWNGIPDKETFIHVASLAKEMYQSCFLKWTNDGLLLFTLMGENRVYYQWDGRTVSEIAFFDMLTSEYYDGRRVLTVEDTSADFLVELRNQHNQVLFTTRGINPAWTSGGYLVFCEREQFGWSLSVWNGYRIISFGRGYSLSARLQGGRSTMCFDI